MNTMKPIVEDKRYSSDTIDGQFLRLCAPSDTINNVSSKTCYCIPPIVVRVFGASALHIHTSPEKVQAGFLVVGDRSFRESWYYTFVARYILKRQGRR